MSHILYYHTTAKVFFKNGGEIFEKGLRLIHDDNSIRDLIAASYKDGTVKVFVDHKLDRDHPKYQKNEEPLSKLKENERLKNKGVNEEELADDEANVESKIDDETKSDDEELSTDEEYQDARKKFMEYTKQMRLVTDPNDVGGIDLNELQQEGAEEHEQGVEEDGYQGYQNKAVGDYKEKAPSNSNDGECADDDSTDKNGYLVNMKIQIYLVFIK